MTANATPTDNPSQVLGHMNSYTQTPWKMIVDTGIEPNKIAKIITNKHVYDTRKFSFVEGPVIEVWAGHGYIVAGSKSVQDFWNFYEGKEDVWVVGSLRLIKSGIQGIFDLK